MIVFRKEKRQLKRQKEWFQFLEGCACISVVFDQIVDVTIEAKMLTHKYILTNIYYVLKYYLKIEM